MGSTILCDCGATLRINIFSGNHVRFSVDEDEFDALPESADRSRMSGLLAGGPTMVECGSCLRLIELPGARNLERGGDGRWRVFRPDPGVLKVAPPDELLVALTTVLFVATTTARNLAAGGRASWKQVEDLMDAVNHISELLGDWGRLQEPILLNHLQCYDQAWSNEEPHIMLEQVYRSALDQAKAKAKAPR